MKRKKLSGMIAVGCLCLFTGGFPVRAASSASYMVTIRPGSVARFSESFLNQYRAAGALVTEKTGSIKIQIPAGGTIPYLPDAGDLVYKDGKEGRYTMNTDWYPKNLTVTGNESLVVKYDALNDAVEYRVRYVDDRSGEDIATPLISQGNEGESYTFYPEKVAGYACDTESRELKLSSKAGDNEVTFRYESTVEPNVNQVVIPGETITETEVVPGDTTIITDGGTRVTEAGGSTSEGTDGAAMGDEGTGQNVVTAGDRLRVKLPESRRPSRRMTFQGADSRKTMKGARIGILRRLRRMKRRLVTKKEKQTRISRAMLLGEEQSSSLRLQDCCFIQENTDCDKRNREMF